MCVTLSCILLSSFFFFFNDTPTPKIYTLSLHDALPISVRPEQRARCRAASGDARLAACPVPRSEEHTSELQSQFHLVCRHLLEKKNEIHLVKSVSLPASVHMYSDHLLSSP